MQILTDEENQGDSYRKQSANVTTLWSSGSMVIKTSTVSMYTIPLYSSHLYPRDLCNNWPASVALDQ